MSNNKATHKFIDLRGDYAFTFYETTGIPNNSLHMHDAYEVLFVLSDGLEVKVNDESYSVPYGSIMLFNSMDLHKLSCPDDMFYQRFVFWFKHDFLDEFDPIRGNLLKCFYVRNFEKANMVTLEREQVPVFVELFKKIVSVRWNETFMQKTLLRLLLSELLVSINKLHSSSHSLTTLSNSKDYIPVYKAMQYLQENHAVKIDQNALARITGTSNRALCKSFVKVSGMTTGQYILNYRINLAKSYLVQGMSVAEVCEKTGFDNWSNFSRTFRNHVGISPKQYAMKYKNG